MVKRILSIDGGGIRGVIPARILAELERRLAKKGNREPLYKHFDLIAGTSTGGIIALGLTIPNKAGSAPVATAADLEKLYVEKGLDIFPRGIWQSLRDQASKVIWPTYSPKPLERILAGLLGERRLSQSLGRVMVTAYDLSNRRAVFLNGAKGQMPADEMDYLAREAARATSAAPTYLPPAEIHPIPASGSNAKDNKSQAMIDGGVFANDPALAAYTEAIKLQCKGIWADQEDIEIISIGTGLSTRSYSLKQSESWGKFGWINPGNDVPIVSVLMHGQQSTISYQMNAILNRTADVSLPDGVHTKPGDGPGKQVYFRFNAKLSDDIDELDDARPATIKALQSIADQIIKDQSAELDVIVSRLT